MSKKAARATCNEGWARITEARNKSRQGRIKYNTGEDNKEAIKLTLLLAEKNRQEFTGHQSSSAKAFTTWSFLASTKEDV